jgi:hypothetical protein
MRAIGAAGARAPSRTKNLLGVRRRTSRPSRRARDAVRSSDGRRARNLRAGITDASLVDEALEALLSLHRAAELDASYAAYDAHPLNEPDAWGDLASFRRAAAAS